MEENKEKRKYNTRKKAETSESLQQIPEHIAVFTADGYEGALLLPMETNKDTPHLLPVTADSFDIVDGKIILRDTSVSADLSKIYNKDREIADIDGALIMYLSTHAVKGIETFIKSAGATPELIETLIDRDDIHTNMGFRVYARDLLAAMGRDPDKTGIFTALRDYDDICGMIPDSPGSKKGELYPFLQLTSYRMTDNTVTIQSPYINKLIFMAFAAAVMRDKNGKPITTRSGKARLGPTHSYRYNQERRMYAEKNAGL